MTKRDGITSENGGKDSHLIVLVLSGKLTIAFSMAAMMMQRRENLVLRSHPFMHFTSSTPALIVFLGHLDNMLERGSLVLTRRDNVDLDLYRFLPDLVLKKPSAEPQLW